MRDQLPLVTVVIPVFNSDRYVVAAVESALSQNYLNKEIIVVDDGSTDRTAEVLKRFGNTISVVRQINAGAAAARNAAMSRAKGKYFAFLDSDDVWLQNKLAMQVEYLETHPEIGMVYSAWQEWHGDTEGWSRSVPTHTSPTDLAVDESNSGWLYNRLLLDCIVHTTTVMIRADTAKKIGLFDESLRRGQDYDYWLRASRVTKIDKLKAALSLYRVHPQSITYRPHTVNYGYVVIKKALDTWGTVGPDGTKTPTQVINHVLARLWFGYGYTHYHTGDVSLASAAFRHCIRYCPFSYAGWIYWFRSGVRTILRSRTG